MATEDNQESILSSPVSHASDETELAQGSTLPLSSRQIQRTGTMGSATQVHPNRLSASRGELRIKTYDQLKQRAMEMGRGEYLVKGLIPKAQIVILVGDSGLGKSAFLYQLGLTIASGNSFLGIECQKGKVDYYDFENGLAETLNIVERQASFLGLDGIPPELNFWHYSDCGDRYGNNGETLLSAIVERKPAVAIIDSLSAFNPLMEDRNPVATQALQKLRGVIRDSGTTIVLVHHLKKPSTRADDAPTPLELAKASDWLKQARGASALINGADVRLGVDLIRRNVSHLGNLGQDSEESAFVLKGFARVHGEIGPFFIARVFDDEGLPLAYHEMTGAQLLFNPDQEAAFARLSDSFTFKDAKRVYGRQDQATADFLKKLQVLS